MTMMTHGASIPPLQDPVLPRWWRTVDRWTLCAVLLLVVFGFLMGLATTPPLAAKNGLDNYFYIGRQATFGCLAFALMVIVSVLSPDNARRTGIILFVLSVLGLFLLPFFGVNHGKGAVRWLSLPGLMTFHPSEFLKPGFVIVVAWLLTLKDNSRQFPGTTISLALSILIACILVLQPDFGHAGMIIFAWGVIYFVAGASISLLILLGAGTVLAGTVAFFTSSHFSGRILAFISETPDPYSQIQYSLKAIKAGGLFGVGIGKGEVKWTLADSHTDLVMAVAAEEFGLIVVLCLLSLFAFISVRAFFLLRKEQDKFIKLAGSGLAALFGIQAFINIGVTAKLLPAKGMTLPFISYGGSSVIAVGLGLGMLLAYTRKRSNGQLGSVG